MTHFLDEVKLTHSFHYRFTSRWRRVLAHPTPTLSAPKKPQPLALKPSRRAACAHHPTVDYAPGSGFSWGLFLKASSRLWVDCPDVAGARTGCAVRKLSWLAQQIAQNVASRHIDRMPLSHVDWSESALESHLHSPDPYRSEPLHDHGNVMVPGWVGSRPCRRRELSTRQLASAMLARPQPRRRS